MALTRAAFVGRSAELHRLQDRLDLAVAGRPQLVLLEGPAGIGKTALIDALLDHVAEIPVVFARGTEQDQLTTFGAARLLIRSAGGSTRDFRADTEAAIVGSALLEQLDLGRRGAALIVVVDDAHWIDRGSIAALTFALRRLRSEPLLVVVAYRPDCASADIRKQLDRDLDGERVALGGLDRDEVLKLVRTVAGVSLAAEAAERLRARTGGSPLHLRAILDEVDPERIADLGRPLPGAGSYSSLVAERLALLRPELRSFLTAVAVLGQGCVLAEAMELAEADVPVADEALASGFLTISGSGPEAICMFGSEVARTVLYDGLDDVDRLNWHARAAVVVTDRATLLRHRALAAHERDAPLANALADHASALAERGELAAAAAQLVTAAKLHNDEQLRATNLLDAVEYAIECDDTAVTERIRDQVAALAPSARSRFALGTLALAAGELATAQQRLVEAWSAPGPATDALRGQIASRLCQICGLQLRTADAVEWGARARAAQGHDSDWYVTSLALSGDPLLATPAEPSGWSLDASIARGARLLWTDDAPGARTELLSAIDGLRQAGRFQSGLRAAGYLALAEYRIGAWGEALARAEQAAALARDADQRWLLARLLATAAMAAAAGGNAARAREHLDAASSAAQVSGYLFDLVCVRIAHAQLAAVAQEHELVVELLEPLVGAVAGQSRCEPGISHWRITLSHSLALLGEAGRADRVLTPYEAAAAEHGRGRARSAAARVRGELDTLAGHPKKAERGFRAAIEHARAAGSALDLGQARAAYGRFLVAAGRHYSAVTELQEARAILERLGSMPDVSDCERALAECGVTALQDPPVAGLLAPRELAVARLLIDGHTDAEVASELMITAAAVRGFLESGMSKLGVATRQDLARALA